MTDAKPLYGQTIRLMSIRTADLKSWGQKSWKSWGQAGLSRKRLPLTEHATVQINVAADSLQFGRIQGKGL